MSENKWTPGPYAAHLGSEHTGPLQEHPLFCEVTGGSFADGSRFTVTGHCGVETAHLFAAAPLMAEALSELNLLVDFEMEVSDEHPMIFADYSAINAAMAKALAALRAARGES